jgi:predicted nucleotidyltransferase
MTEQVLFKTLIGSHMWGMNHAGSDRDYMVVYLQSTKDILSGYPVFTGKPNVTVTEDGVECDYQYMEIGHLINLLLKGNVNAIWTVTSPCIIEDSPELQQLRGLVQKNLSKSSFASINGMAISQIKDETKRKSMKGKGYRTGLRTLNFGIKMFEKGKLVYDPVGEVTGEDVEIAFHRFNTAYMYTKLPEEPDVKSFRNYLYKIRKNNEQVINH